MGTLVRRRTDTSTHCQTRTGSGLSGHGSWKCWAAGPEHQIQSHGRLRLLGYRRCPSIAIVPKSVLECTLTEPLTECLTPPKVTPKSYLGPSCCGHPCRDPHSRPLPHAPSTTTTHHAPRTASSPSWEPGTSLTPTFSLHERRQGACLPSHRIPVYQTPAWIPPKSLGMLASFARAEPRSHLLRGIRRGVTTSFSPNSAASTAIPHLSHTRSPLVGLPSAASCSVARSVLLTSSSSSTPDSSSHGTSRPTSQQLIACG